LIILTLAMPAARPQQSPPGLCNSNPSIAKLSFIAKSVAITRVGLSYFYNPRDGLKKP
jgi:hypothetical protein